MERNVVLIEIECGRVTAYAPAGTLIALHDRDTDGNYGMLCRQKHNEPAFKVLSERLGERECDTPDYVLEILDNPRPFIDWGKEANRLAQLREKSITYIAEHTEYAFFVYSGADIVYKSMEDGKRMITVGWDGEDSDIAEKEEVEDLDISVLVMICDTIQKAIEGGTKA